MTCPVPLFHSLWGTHCSVTIHCGNVHHISIRLDLGFNIQSSDCTVIIRRTMKNVNIWKQTKIHIELPFIFLGFWFDPKQIPREINNSWQPHAVFSMNWVTYVQSSSSHPSSVWAENKPINTKCRLFFIELCGIVFNRFHRLEIHSLMVGIFGPACELFPQGTKELYLCTVAPLTSLLPPLLPKLNVQTVCGCGGGGGGVGGVELCCRPYSAVVLHSVS